MKTRLLIICIFCPVIIFAQAIGNNITRPGKQLKPSAKKTAQPRLTEEQKALKTLANNMVFIEGGTYIPGSLNEEDDDSKNMRQQKITLSSFYLCKYEVTQKIWDVVMGNTLFINNKTLEYPVTDISWQDCQVFIERLNILTQKNYRLPTEYEWEYAARGGIKSKGYKYSGSDVIDDVAWFNENANNTSHNVGMKMPNELGLYDMSGNVREWCSNWTAGYGSDPSRDPLGPYEGTHRAIRGGHWQGKEVYCRVFRRSWALPTVTKNTGLRLAMDVVAQSKVPKERLDGILAKIVDNMVKINGGTFVMGNSITNDQNTDSIEMPAHTVSLSPFSISKYEVSQEEWEAVMGTNPSYFIGSQRPVENVNWDDCQKFISRLNQLTNKKFRLPTEAEWEFAARGGNNSKQTKYPGSQKTDDIAWTKDNSSNGTHERGLLKSNELGLYDMGGNVSEWCADWYELYKEDAQNNPKGAASGVNKICRGGSWNYEKKSCRVSDRTYCWPTHRLNYIGFRLAM